MASPAQPRSREPLQQVPRLGLTAGRRKSLPGQHWDGLGQGLRSSYRATAVPPPAAGPLRCLVFVGMSYFVT